MGVPDLDRPGSFFARVNGQAKSSFPARIRYYRSTLCMGVNRRVRGRRPA